MQVAPGADPADGLLEVVFVEQSSKRRFLANLPKVFTGKHVEVDAVSVHRAREVEIAADRPFDVYADGEPITTLPATVRLVRGGAARDRAARRVDLDACCAPEVALARRRRRALAR